VIELAWDMGTDGDLSHYVIDVSRAPDPWESVGGYPRTIRATSHRIGWGWVFPCYWRIKAVDWNGNMSAWCDIQIALAAWPEAPGIPNPGFEDGVGAPDHWTLTTAGRVTASWGTDINPKSGVSTRPGKLVVTAGSGGGDVDALVSGIFEINRFQSYGLGCSVLRKAAADNIYHFVVLQYQDAGGTPAATPRRELGDVGFVGVDAWSFQSDVFTVWPDDDDVSHIAVAIVVDHATTYNQEVHFDDFKCILREWVQFPEERGPVDDDLSNYMHVSLAKTVTAQHTYAPAAAQAPFVLGANAQGQIVTGLNADQLQGLEPTDDPGTAAAVLATDASGHLTLVQLNTDTLTDRSGGNLTLAPAGDLVLNPGGNDILPDAGYDLNLGSLTKQFLTLHAAELWVQTLVAQATMATGGGRILVGPTTRLAADLGDSAGNTTITVEHNNLANGDRVVMQAAGKLEWMAVTSAAGGVGPYTYTVTRNLDGSGRNLWYAGDAVFNTGTTGDGHIDLYSVSGVIPGSTAGPTIVGNVRYGTTYSQIRPAWAIGNLNGLYGYAADVMGVALGQYSEADYITVDPTNGIRFFDSGDAVRAQLSAGAWTLGNASTEHVAISSTAVQIKDGATVLTNISGGNVLVGQTGAGQSNVYITSGAVQLRTNTTVNLELTTAGQIVLGDDAGGEYVTVDSNGIEMYSGAVKVVDIANNGDFIFGQVAASKSNIFFDQSPGRLNFRGGAAGTTVQAYIDTTGELMAGGGAVRINSAGIQGYAGATQRFNLASDGSGWVGASDVLRWTTAGVVAFKAAGLVDPWETPSLTDALYMPNRYGGGQRMWAWEATWSQIQTCLSYKTFLISGGPFYTDYKCTATGGPYYDLDGGSNAMLIQDGGGATDGWQEPGGNNFFVWAWVNADTLATNSRTILAKWDYITGGNLSWVLYYDYTNSRFAFTVSSDGSDTDTVRDTNVPATGTWYFVAGFFQPSTRLRILVAPASAATLTATDNTTGIPAAIYDSSSPFALGMMASWASGAGFYWDGGIGVHSAYRGLPAATVTNYAQLLFEKTKQFYGG